MLDEAGITEQRAALCDAAGQAFYNTSRFTLRDLKSRGSQQQLLADFEDYLNGFSPNVQDILDNFKFRNQLPRCPRPTPRHADQQVPRPRHRPLAGRHRQPLDGHRVRGTGAQVQRGQQRRGRRALDAARRRAPDGQPGVPADRVRDQVRHLPALRLRLRHRRHAHRGRGDAHRHRQASAASRSGAPLRPGDQPRDLRHLQGRHAAQGRRRERRPHRRRRRVVHAGARRLPRQSSTSCSPTRPTARAGRRTWRRWAARTACATRASRSCTRARSFRSSRAPATARCSSSPTWRRR
jgi:hypothetical protein